LNEDVQTAFNQLADQLAYVLELALQQHPERLFSALYRIDLPEKDFRNYWIPGQESDSSYHLAASILEREMIKVISRKLHS
jgi:hypothetical protein